jgi:hypothetical protein
VESRSRGVPSEKKEEKKGIEARKPLSINAIALLAFFETVHWSWFAVK